MLTIGTLGRRAGVKATTIRYYEGLGLIRADGRSAGNQRLYAPEAVARLSFIRHGREMGFGLEAIGALLALSDHPEADCARADALARARLAEVEARLAGLLALRDELRGMVARCAGGTAGECGVIGQLADHRQCQGGHGHAGEAAPL